jgi:hypothetical protein
MKGEKIIGIDLGTKKEAPVGIEHSAGLNEGEIERMRRDAEVK